MVLCIVKCLSTKESTPVGFNVEPTRGHQRVDDILRACFSAILRLTQYYIVSWKIEKIYHVVL